MKFWAWLVVSAALAGAGCATDEIVLFHLDQVSAPGTTGGSDFIGTGGATIGSGGSEAGGSATGGRLAGKGGIIGSGGIIASGGTVGSGGSIGSGGAGGVPSSGGVVNTGGAALEGGPPSGCSTEFDCPGGWTCSKLDCNAATGSCEPKPILCDPTPQPVCGCNHITYWNDCQRRQNGVEASTPGQCGVGTVSCNTSLDCGTMGAFCAHVFPLPCGQQGPGTCWILPLDCSATPPSPRWVSCASPFGGCVDTCTAIRSGQPYAPAPPGMSCGP